MTKQELKTQYKLNKMTAREYFLALGKIIKSEAPVYHGVPKKRQVAKTDGLPLFK